MSDKKNIVLGVTGSIAAHKAVDICSLLAKGGAAVHVVMTKDAQEFVTPLPFKTLSQNPVVESLYDEEEGWRPTHIHLADTADLLLIAPATANTIAKLAAEVNRSVENIGARRLHTVMERLLDEISFTATDRPGETIQVDSAYVEERVGDLAKDADLSKFIL